jgi:hypothetical protein
MEPFIMHFGVTNNQTKAVSFNCKYSVLYEQKTYIDAQNCEKLVIENPNVIADTGSYITRAQTDPTSDESSDR